jgi:nucleoside-diphosphate-sugar epimerase
VAAELAARQLALRGQGAHRLLVDLQELRQLLDGEHIGLPHSRSGTPDDDIVGTEITVDQIGDKLPLRRLQLEGGPAQPLGGRSRQADEEGRRLLTLHDIKISSCYRRRVAQRAFLLGGTGKTGVALARQLAARGWEVTLASRGRRDIPSGFTHVQLDRADSHALRAALGDGVDALVDFVAFEREHADQLLSLHDLVRSIVVVSSAAVYADAHGRSLEEIRSGEVVEFPVPIPERQRTVDPDGLTYGAKKAAIERRLLSQDRIPATAVRAGAIYGPGDDSSREWHFVKRVLDGRRFVLLAHRGESRFHPVAVDNLAELLRLAVERPGWRVLNAGDPVAPTVLEISRAIARAMGHEWTEILLPGAPPGDGVGDNPWALPKPWILDMTEAEFGLGYRPVTTYGSAVREAIEWLVEATRGRDWREVLPVAAEHYEQSFDYAAEDDFLRTLAGG